MVMTNLTSKIKQINAKRKLSIIEQFFRQSEKLLDFGCGDLLLDEYLLRFNPKLEIFGVDVVDFNCRPKGIKFYTYDGKRLPFDDKTFDTVLIFHVLHHCPDPIESLQECIRVAKKRIIIVEPVYRSNLEIPIMKFLDWLYNAWKSLAIDRNNNFFSKKQWENIIRKNDLEIGNIKDIDIYPEWIPVGRAYLFLLNIKNK